MINTKTRNGRDYTRTLCDDVLKLAKEAGQFFPAHGPTLSADIFYPFVVIQRFTDLFGDKNVVLYNHSMLQNTHKDRGKDGCQCYIKDFLISEAEFESHPT